MKLFTFSVVLFLMAHISIGQNTMTPELLHSIKRLSVIGSNEDNTILYFKASVPNIESNDFDQTFYSLTLSDGTSRPIAENQVHVKNNKLSPDSTYVLYHKEVHLEDIHSTDIYKNLKKSNAYVYNNLDYRHWDKWNRGSYNHVFYRKNNPDDTIGTDIMKGEPYYTPQEPFGGGGDYIWGPHGENIYYVSKKLKGADYAQSTNTDIYKYNLSSSKTINITSGNKGYDTNPSFSNRGTLAYLQMKKEGYESDKNDIIILDKGDKINLTNDWDGTVFSYRWSNNSEKIYFTAPVDGTIQLFEVGYPGGSGVHQISKGQYDIRQIVLEVEDGLIVTRTDMNHAAEIFKFYFKDKKFEQLSHLNDKMYEKLTLPTIEKRYITTTDNKQMLVWVIYPPHFDPNKRYPTLLYAQGGPQSPLSQFYSFRWNFQVMASQGYIVVAPNRRGMPGFGVKWNADISKDWGGQAIQDYLSAIDTLKKEPYVDGKRIGAIGASFGGYSVYYLAGMHNGRFKTFIAHCGVFDNRSMYGTTEELFFVNHDIGGPYWDKKNVLAQKGYSEFNPISNVAKWNTPIFIIHGGKDYRVPLGQGLSAFQAAKVLGLQARLLYLPEENHWVSSPQNALVWQYEFFKWLKETL